MLNEPSYIYRTAPTMSYLKQSYRMQHGKRRLTYLDTYQKEYEKCIERAKAESKTPHKEYKNDMQKTLAQANRAGINYGLFGPFGTLTGIESGGYTKEDWDKVIKQMEECLKWVKNERKFLEKETTKLEAYMKAEVDDIFGFEFK